MEPITANIVKYTIQPESGAERNVTQFVKDWDGLEVALTRYGNSGVLTDVESALSLVGDDKEFVKELFEASGVRARATFRVYRRRAFSNDYDLVMSAPLDFASYSETNIQVDIECNNNDLLNVVKSSESTKYEISLDKVADSKRWAYQRMNMYNAGNYTIATTDDVGEGSTTDYMRPSITLSNAEMVYHGPEHDFKSQSLGAGPSDYFFKAKERVHITVDINLDMDVYTTQNFPILYATQVYAGIGYKPGGVDNRIDFPSGSRVLFERIDASPPSATWRGSVNLHWEYDLDKDDSLVFLAGIAYESFLPSEIYAQIAIKRFGHFAVRYTSKGEEFTDSDGLKVVKPEILLQTFLDKMGGENRFTSGIVWRKQEFDIVIVPAESIRNKIDAKINGSFKDFVKWMTCLGYEFEITGNSLTFRDRNYFYNKEITTLALKEDELGDLVTSVNADECYTVVKVGYENQDYDGKANGAYESFGTYEYTTGFEYSEEIELDLVSPYRADPIGIESLLSERDKSTSKDKDDKNIFFVAVNKQPEATYIAAENGDRIITESGDNMITETSEISPDPYTEYIDERIYTGIVNELGVSEMVEFNAVFHPRIIVEYNASLIGVNASLLAFAGTEAYGGARYYPSSYPNLLYEDIWIGESLHEPVEYNFAAGYLPDLPSDKRGLVRFTYKGKQKQGFIKQIAKNYSKEQSIEWTLYKVRKA